MADRQAITTQQKMPAWMRAVEDRLSALERRKVQGNLALDTLQMNGALAVNGGLSIDGTTFPDDLYLPGLTWANLIASAAISPIASTSPTTTDIAGCEYTVTKRGVYLALAAFDINVTVAGATNVQGWIQGTGSVPNPASAERALGPVNSVGRFTMTTFAFLSAGNGVGTIKMSVTKAAALGTCSLEFNALATHLNILRVA